MGEARRSGTPIVLIHGLSGSSRTVVAQHRRVLVNAAGGPFALRPAQHAALREKLAQIRCYIMAR